MASQINLQYETHIFLQQEDQKKFADENFTEKNGDMGDVPKIKLSTKKMLKGHINKVTTCHFSGDSRF
jgi:guanine nucleotide-binding protein subunit beta, other